MADLLKTGDFEGVDETGDEAEHGLELHAVVLQGVFEDEDGPFFEEEGEEDFYEGFYFFFRLENLGEELLTMLLHAQLSIILELHLVPPHLHLDSPPHMPRTGHTEHPVHVFLQSRLDAELPVHLLQHLLHHVEQGVEGH